jgi:hypothetical protein
METTAARHANSHVKIVVAEGKVTMEELHSALDHAVKSMVPKGGCNCGLTGFDISFLRGDPALKELGNVANIHAGFVTRE